MKKLFSLICFVAMVLPGMLLAADSPDGHHGFKNPEVKKYITQNIMPVLYEKRQVLENELTPAEKTEIAECRTALATLRAQEHKLRKERWAAKQADEKISPESTDTKDAFAEIRKQQHEIMLRVEKVADMHSTTLSGIRADLEPLHKKWTTDLTQIKIASNTNKEENNDYSHWGLPQFSLSSHRATTFFLLMEPTSGKSSSAELKSEQFASSPIAPVSLSAFSVMPNPASNEIITGNDPLPATNELALFDIQGRKVLSVENVQAAQHFDISTLPAGSYIVQLTSGDQAASRQMVISH
jgi:hypothetical protein